MRQRVGSALVQIMACRLFSAKPLLKPLMVCCQLNSLEQVSMKFESYFYHYTPAPPKVEWGYTGFTPMSVRPSVRPSFRPSVDKVSGTFWKKLLAQFISYLAFPLMGWVLNLIHFHVPSPFSALWWPNLWPKMGFPELFENNYWPNSFHTWHLPLWGESLDPYTFSCS